MSNESSPLTTNQTERQFSMNFQLIHTIGTEEIDGESKEESWDDEMKEFSDIQFPTQVRISHKYNCILISCQLWCRIQILDYETRQVVNTVAFSTRFVNFVIDECHDCLIISDETNMVTSYDLTEIIKNGVKKVMWKNNLLSKPFGMAIREEQIFVAHAEGVAVLNSLNGEVISRNVINDSSATVDVYDVCFITHQVFVVSCYKHNKCCAFKEKSSGEWNEIYEITSPTTQLNPLGMTFDAIGKMLFICDFHNTRIVVVNENGNYVTEYSGDGKELYFQGPYGIHFEERTGWLYVTDITANVVRIFT